MESTGRVWGLRRVLAVFEEAPHGPGSRLCRTTHRLLSSSFLGFPYRILNRNHKKELLWSLWVVGVRSKLDSQL